MDSEPSILNHFWDDLISVKEAASMLSRSKDAVLWRMEKGVLLQKMPTVW
jgi:hypothetical protein